MKATNRKSNNNEEVKRERVIREGVYEYDSLFAGVNQYGIYLGMRSGDDTTFISGYEALGIINNILNELDMVKIEYGKAVSKKDTEYESAKVIDYKI